MTPEAQRIAIAKVCGWIMLPDHAAGRYNPVGINPASGLTDHIPDYLRDLNAMHEAEKVARKDPLLWQKVVNKLNETLSVDDAIHATTTQRAEAFLKTLNLWK